jgi:hypothetical protein
MVKLIKLRGNSDKSDVEIRNHFSDSIRVKPNSKIALRSAYADLFTQPSATTFPLVEAAQYIVNLGGTTPDLTVTVPKSQYQSVSALLRAMQIAGNGTDPSDDIYLGTHLVWDVVNSPQNSRLRVYKAQQEAAGYNTAWIWDDETVFSFYDDTDFTLAGTATATVFGHLPQLIPLVSSEFTFKYNVNGDITVAAGEYDEPNSNLWGMRVNNTTGTGNYLALVNGVEVDTGATPAVDDLVIIKKEGDSYTLSITDSVGGNKLLQTYTLNADTLAKQSLFYRISAPATSTAAVQDSNLYVINNLDPNDSLLQSITVDANLKFPTSPESPNAGTIEIQHYLGFKEEEYKTKGDPATFVSETTVRGSVQYPGVMLTIDGLDLDTYNGTPDSYPQQLNILDVIYPEEKLTKVRYEPPYPMRLDLKNPNEIVIRDLTLHFAQEEGNNIKYLKFKGSPVITLEIAEQGEYLD